MASRNGIITLTHGSGGLAQLRLIEELFVEIFRDPELKRLEDQARLAFPGGQLAFTTDGYVVDPPFFPGGDIGKLAVCGTVNDLAVGGARPLYLSCAFILEEGFDLARLEAIARSMKRAADEAGVRLVTGDTKVVPKGAADEIFIATSGVGVIPEGFDLGVHRIEPGDRILVSGPIGDHGAAILDARGELGLEHALISDCRPLNRLIERLLAEIPVHAMRDPTRGGLAAVLYEFARKSQLGFFLDEEKIPVREEVRAICELLGLDPLYLACEGRVVAFVPECYAERALAVMRDHPSGSEAAIIGEVREEAGGEVVLRTPLGGERLVDLPEGEMLPRIC